MSIQIDREFHSLFQQMKQDILENPKDYHLPVPPKCQGRCERSFPSMYGENRRQDANYRILHFCDTCKSIINVYYAFDVPKMKYVDDVCYCCGRNKLRIKFRSAKTYKYT